MTWNSFGRLLRITTFGESHGEAIGVVVDGCPADITIDLDFVQQWLNARKPGQNRFVTQRQEADKLEVLSGLWAEEGQTNSHYKTLGTPIALLIKNQDMRSKDYSQIARQFRPGHADYTYQQKYGIRDYRGGGRSSARETAARVAAGAVAHQILQFFLGQDYALRAGLISLGQIETNPEEYDWSQVWQNEFYTPDLGKVAMMKQYLDKIRKAGSSVGGKIEVRAIGIPAGLGAPIYGKLSADLAAAMMGINAVKAVEIGDGMLVAGAKGEENNDAMRAGDDGKVEFLSNHAGGILGGISTGQEIIMRLAVKPTSSILTPQSTVEQKVTGDYKNVEISTHGRHDPAVVIRAVPIVRAMMALVLCDHWLLQRAIMHN